MIFGAILAGGVGSRMRIADMPKQFLPLGDKPIVIRTLETFLDCTRLDAVYIGVHPEWLPHMRDLLVRYIPQHNQRVHITAGGGDRNETLFRVINAIEQDFGESEDHILLTHDAVRPFVTARIIEENINAAIQYGAVDTVIPATDTIIVSEDGKTVSCIPDRRKLYQSQTPQSFRMSLLKKLYLDLSEEEKASLTDACKICVVRKTPVYMVKGEVSNLKITTADNYRIAQGMVNIK